MSIEALSFEQTTQVFGGSGRTAEDPLFSSPPAGFVATGLFDCNGSTRFQIYINLDTFETVCVFEGTGCSGGPHIGL
ncbi:MULTISPECIES: hypothetical protein [Kordiimonas]|uniref:hypothetical protein n=1 Tax=Kordiimonas TaxID=288021 RepID=UPI001FF4D291|nr:MULTISPECIES: hypothetical protein [Kordiimonas]MCK0068952.1 hypothetical protein [Kordiimonas laminariae]UTW58299.1 hypothetical protein KFE96_15955 [Kordiimonas sp. SCSIO 12603]